MLGKNKETGGEDNILDGDENKDSGGRVSDKKMRGNVLPDEGQEEELFWNRRTG